MVAINFMSLFVPQEKKFFSMLQEQSSLLLDGATAFKGLMDDYNDVDRKVGEINKIEALGDRCVHDIIYALNTTFITPIDREDIHFLTSKMDDVLDFTDGAAGRLSLYRIKTVPPKMRELAGILLTSVEELNKAINSLEDFDTMRKCCIEINKLENDADTVFRHAIAELFEGGDVINILKLKEIYVELETATDRCEDVADILSSIVVKHG